MPRKFTVEMTDEEAESLLYLVADAVGLRDIDTMLHYPGIGGVVKRIKLAKSESRNADSISQDILSDGAYLTCKVEGCNWNLHIERTENFQEELHNYVVQHASSHKSE
jgi:hypothetical protein